MRKKEKNTTTNYPIKPTNSTIFAIITWRKKKEEEEATKRRKQSEEERKKEKRDETKAGFGLRWRGGGGGRHVCVFSVGPVHYSWDSQVQISANFSLKLGPTILFTHLKILLLQYFQFSIINGIQTDLKRKNPTWRRKERKKKK